MPPHSKPSVGGERFINLAKTQMVEAARKGGGKARPQETRNIKVEILVYIATSSALARRATIISSICALPGRVENGKSPTSSGRTMFRNTKKWPSKTGGSGISRQELKAILEEVTVETEHRAYAKRFHAGK